MKSATFKGFRRFADLTIRGLPETARLVVLCGPNGSGKSSVFDGFEVWHGQKSGGTGPGWDVLYHQRQETRMNRGEAPAQNPNWHESVDVSFFEAPPAGQPDAQRAFYFRSAYRQEPEFNVSSISRLGSPFEGPRVRRMIDTDVKVSNNYHRLVGETVANVYDDAFDETTVKALRDRLIGRVRDSMQRVFGDLVLTGPGDPLNGGTFLFDKGSSHGFQYKNLSGGEKAAFDLLLDFIVKGSTYYDAIFCIDEPELHMNTRLQARLLGEMVAQLPPASQLWIATHSIGMLRTAQDMQRADGGSVVFLDFQGRDFDDSVIVEPIVPDRDFWKRTLDVALGDLAGLVAPARVVLCEGRPTAPQGSAKAEFDARCYRAIFSTEFPDTDFVSVGSEQEVRTDTANLGQTIQTLVQGAKLARVVDRDARSPQEVTALTNTGVRVLTRRHLESYLLDEEVLDALCAAEGRPNQVTQVRAAMQAALAASVARNNPSDDYKSAAGEAYDAFKRILGLRQPGNSWEAFLRDTMTGHLKPGMRTYAELRADIFGSSP